MYNYAQPIPLSETVREMEEVRAANQLEFKANVLSQVAQQNQHRAQLLLHKKGPLNPNARSGPSCYIQEEEEEEEEEPADSDSKPAKALSTSPRRDPTSAKLKRQLPSFYASGGQLLSGSIVQLSEGGDYCVPSQKKSTKTNKTESFFLTQLPADAKHTRSKLTRPCKDNNEKLSTSSSSSSHNWLPLSSGALAEYSGVTEVAVKGQGHLAHGQYSLWRPPS